MAPDASRRRPDCRVEYGTHRLRVSKIFNFYWTPRTCHDRRVLGTAPVILIMGRSQKEGRRMSVRASRTGTRTGFLWDAARSARGPAAAAARAARRRRPGRFFWGEEDSAWCRVTSRSRRPRRPGRDRRFARISISWTSARDVSRRAYSPCDLVAWHANCYSASARCSPGLHVWPGAVTTGFDLRIKTDELRYGQRRRPVTSRWIT